ncbi:hypothetical protein BaRGS_00028069, partial [Batillaria attramentaria]
YQIRDCETHVDVREDTETSIVCDGIGATHRMYWSIYSTNFDEQTIGYCTNTLDCTDKLPDYEVSRPTPTSSELKIKANFREKANKQIKCSRWNNVSSDSCTLRIVYPASPKLLLFNTDGATWTMEASCQVPKVFSSDNTYACILNRTGPDQENVFTVRADLLSRTELADSSPTYYSGRCSWNESLPSVSGEYTYYISILPGKPDTAYTVGTAVIDPPADPEIRCRRYAIENTNHTCQCRTSTSRPGNPTPQVTWNQNPGSSELKLVNVQREDDGNVEDDGTEVKCTATNNETSSFSTVVSEVISLRYPPPAQPIITGLIEGQPLLEGTSVLMTCTVQGGNPPVTSVNFSCGSHVDTADTVYEADVIEATSAQVSQLTINNKVDDIIVNAGDNGSVILSCTPKLAGDSQTLGLPTNPLVVSNQESSMDLIAFPVPSTRSIVFLGTATPTVDSFQGSGDSSTALGVQCQPDDETLYISRCTVRVSSDSAANGFYRVTLGNQVGSAVFLIHLDLPKQEASSSVPVPAIAGGVGGAVVIIVIIIIVVVIVSRRKRKLNKRKERTTKADDEEFEEHINPVYDMEDTPEDDLKDKPKPTAVAWRVSPQSHLMNDLEDGTPVEDDRDAGYSSLSMETNQQPTIFSSTDDDTYSSVDDDGPNIQVATNNRPQFNDQDADDYAVVGAEGDESNTAVPREDVSAVVDKTKKKQQSSDSTTPSLSAAESSGNSGQTGDVYAVTDKTKKKRQTSDNTSSSPAASAQSTNTGIAGPNGDVYAQVNKSLRGKTGTDTSQQKPTVKPKLAPKPKPKPALKPKPSVSAVGDVTKDGNSVSGLGAGVESDPYEDIEFTSPESPSSVTDAQNMTTMQATETDDEYNTLRFDNNNPTRETAADDIEYSHLGSV